MRKLIIIFFIATMITGCGVNNTTNSTNSNLLYSSEYGNTYSYDEPFDISYGSGKIEVKEIKLYQEKSDHGYYAYPVLIFDISSLSDDDTYWLNKEMKTSILFTNVNNNIDSEHGDPVCYHADSNNNYVVFEVGKEQKYSFEQSKITVFIDIENTSLSDTYILSAEVEPIDTSEMNSDLYQAIVDAYNRKLEYLKDLF